MRELIAYSAMAATVGLTVIRPAITTSWRVGPATAAGFGAIIMLAAGVVGWRDVAASGALHWRPFVTIVSIMTVAAVARETSVMDALARRIFASPVQTARGLFVRVFLFSALVSSILNNDAMVLLVTPLVIALVRQRFPGREELAVPFAFAVFLSIGVAPFVVANPMNMIVASYAHLNFNQYASWMIPVAVAGWAVVLPLAAWFFRRELAAVAPEGGEPPASGTVMDGSQKAIVALLLAMVAAYPVVALIDGPSIWLVALAGAVLALALSVRSASGVRQTVIYSVDWNILVFLLSVYVLAVGMRNVGLIDFIASFYSTMNLAVIGGVSALGSALVNNHPMAIINLLALEAVPEAGRREILAALVGGDIGPRLLPIGSLAGLLWIESCRRSKVAIPLRTFMAVGILVTVPSMAVSLLILWLR